MCGIVGHLRLDPSAAPPDGAALHGALNALRHRGPDGQGEWRSADARCWLGHTRLAIIDLATGAQPMATPDDRYAITFNGEIYNYRELRGELERQGHVFRTRSDTEVILLGARAWGTPGVVRRLNGIFAFALYDAHERRLTLARDHAGVKPLYWWSDGREFAFASETKALLRFPAVQRTKQVNAAGVAQLIVTRTVSRPGTMLAGVHRLPEAGVLEVDDARIGAPRTYWDQRFAPQPITEADAVAALDTELRAVVERQLIADVPVGVQLSGGVDSSLVTALMDRIRRERGSADAVRSFSIGFDIAEFSELGYARQVAERYGTEHHEIVVGAGDFVADLARLAWYHDEPMGEPSAIPGYYMCRASKPHVTVMLCGEGADERFGGYSKYSFEALARRIAPLPGASAVLRRLAVALPFRARRIVSALEIAALPDEAHRFASWFGGFDAHNAQGVLHAEYRRAHGDGGLHAAYRTILDACTTRDPLERFLYCDGHARLVDDILVKGDRMSMAAGVEARVPFLDPTLTELAARLPSSLKARGTERKRVLKKVAEKYLPREVIHRRKVGFTVPLTRWFTGPLAGMLRGVLLSERSLARGYFDPTALRKVVDGHLQQRVDREQALWVLLALEIWHRLFIDDDGSEQAVQRVQDSLPRTAAA